MCTWIVQTSNWDSIFLITSQCELIIKAHVERQSNMQTTLFHVVDLHFIDIRYKANIGCQLCNTFQSGWIFRTGDRIHNTDEWWWFFHHSSCGLGWNEFRWRRSNRLEPDCQFLLPAASENAIEKWYYLWNMVIDIHDWINVIFHHLLKSQLLSSPFSNSHDLIEKKHSHLTAKLVRWIIYF